MKKLLDLLPLVLDEIDGESERVIEIAIRQVLLDFCSRTRFVTMRTDPEPLRAGAHEYDLFADSGWYITEVTACWVDGKPLEPVGARTLFGQDSGTPTGFGRLPDQPDVLLLVPTPLESIGSVVALLQVQPTQDAKQMPDHVFHRWGPGLAYGVKGRMMGLKDKPYTNEARAMFCAGLYEQAIVDATNEADTGGVKTILRTRSAGRL